MPEPWQTLMCRKDPSLWLGSCFAEVLGQRAKNSGYPATVNPMGTVFHPIVLARLLTFSPEELEAACFEKEDVWLNYWLGAPFAAPVKPALIHQIQSAQTTLNAAVSEASWLILTWGTAWYYKHKDWGWVGKCHKLPGNQFDRFRSSPDEIYSAWQSVLERLWTSNPDLKVVVTVSPVRHSREGLVENNRSKAALLLAAGALSEAYKKIVYFPSYELVMDELRDYRFFGSDLVHPNDQAQDYVWKVFSEQAFHPVEQQTNLKLERFRQLKRHTPLVAFGSEYQSWQAALQREKTQLSNLLRAEGLPDACIETLL
jgi:hypothetical protein